MPSDREGHGNAYRDMYTHITYTQLRSLVLERLGDGIFYTDTEVKRYVLEALRTWNALAQFSRDRGTFNTSAGLAFYSLPASLDNGGTKILGYNLLDQDLFIDLKYSLMENASTVNSWTGTSQFTLQQCQDALEKAKFEFHLRTNLVQNFLQVSLPAPPASRVSISDGVIDITRVAFLSSSPGSSYIPLIRTEEASSSSFFNNWNNNPATPYGYSVIMTPKVSLQLIPVSITGGTLDVICLSTGSSLDLTSGVLLSIPDDWAWAIKWKALFYLLSKDGEATDQARAGYCNQRFEEAIIAAKVSSTIQSTFINDIALLPTTINNLDRYTPSWQSTSGTPAKIALAGRNLVALSPVPDGIYSVTMDSIINQPIPVNDGDFIQVGREHINAIVDYAVHLAMFKQGGSEFFNTMTLKDNLYTLAMENNYRLKAQAAEMERLRDYSRKQEMEVPMYATPVGA